MNKFNILFLLLISIFITACGNDPETDTNTNKNTKTDLSKTFRWKMVTTWPANFPIFQEGAQKFADDVKQMSNGRLDIRVYAGGELVPPLQVFDAVSQGVVEMGHGSPYYWAGKVPAAQFFSSVPFGMTAKGMNAWLYNGGGLELWREIYKPFNLTAFPMGNTGLQMGGWFNKQINSVEDISGLRMRIPGLGGKVFKKAGGNPVLMAGGEIYTALERGTIDATEWVAPFHDMRLGLNRAANFYYYPGWHEPGTVFELMINLSKWSQLSPDLQKIVEVAAAATSEWIYAQMEFHNQEALKELKTKQNVQILEFPEEVLLELKRLTNETLNEEAATNPEFKRVYDAYESFRKNYQSWNELSDEAYQDSLRLK
ncbi:MAG: TRAP transporter substrate-binding protein [Proteobacteria bacterium]|nr:TRAP transporter substrate-binding protein [Pseudomonadota bacterium]